MSDRASNIHLDTALAAQTRPGQVALIAARRMRVGEDTEATVRMIQGTHAKVLTGADLGKATKAETIRVTPRMRASLHGDGFQIVPRDSAEQLVGSDETTIWTFDVRPTRSGLLTLTADVTQVLDRDGKSGVRSVEAPPLSVSVEADYVYSTMDWATRHKDLFTFLVPSGVLATIAQAILARKKKPEKPHRK